MTGRHLLGGGRAFKCTMCYDRLGAGQDPACAKACPTESIQFGPLEELRERAALRVDQLHADGVETARLYGHAPDDGVGGDGAFFLLRPTRAEGWVPDGGSGASRPLSLWHWRARVATMYLKDDDTGPGSRPRRRR